jgi:hypothetical protein
MKRTLPLFGARASAAPRHVLAATLAVLLFAQPSFALSQPVLRPFAVVPSAFPAEEQALQIMILDGEGALNNIRQRTAREPIVQVEDKNHKPVAGALVLFAINETNGAGATIDGASTFRAVTDANGQVHVHNYLPNGNPGKFTITIRATIGPLTTDVIMHQENKGEPTASTNSQPKPVHSLHNFIFHNPLQSGIVVGGLVAVGLVVALVLTHNSGAHITVGAGTVGKP